MTLEEQIKKLSADDARTADEDTFVRLANLPRVEYDKVRQTEAERIGCRVTTLDAEVDARRPHTNGEQLQGRGISFPSIEPWTEPVNGADVLNGISATFDQYVHLPPGAADALALWVSHAHCFEAFTCSPRLNIRSEVKGCGKTTLRDVVNQFVPRPLPTENLSVAVLFRVTEAEKPTLLIDEADAWLRDDEELRGMLNAGHRRGGQALRCEGESNEVRAYSVFTPCVLCGIGSLPATLHDRSVVVRLERAKRDELRARFDTRRVENEQVLCRKLARWIGDFRTSIEGCDPRMPQGAFNRVADNWRPLAAIAEIAGGDWPSRLVKAFSDLLTADDGADAHGIDVMLLSDVRMLLERVTTPHVFTKDLVSQLISLEDRPWSEIRREKPITAPWLARHLGRFGLTTKSVRVGSETAKGYAIADFQPAIERFLADGGQPNRHTVTTADTIGENSLSKPSHSEGLLRFENAEKVNAGAGCDGVTVSRPLRARAGRCEMVEEALSIGEEPSLAL